MFYNYNDYKKWHTKVLILVCCYAIAFCKPLADTSRSITIYGFEREPQQQCHDQVYCMGDLLNVVQLARIFNDSKTFVDMTQVSSPDKTLSNFEKLMNNTNNNPSKSQVEKFVNENFADESELDDWTPPDYKTDPAFLAKIDDKEIRGFAKNVVSIWSELGRKVKDNVKQNPDQHSLLPVPNGFIIPGGRFRELYYWDSYWIVKGLLLSEMTDTVRGMLENFIYLIDKYGFVPNGSRVYYLNRSQPPLLSLMVAEYLQVTNDVVWLNKHIDTLDNELKFWLNNRFTVVEKDGVKHNLAHYASTDGTPRPESYYEDIKACAYYANDDKKQESCYKELKSGAESGWDFSTRWFFDSSGGTNTNLTFIETTRVAPVDLNAFLCRAFREMSNFYKLIQNEGKAVQWLERAVTLQKSVELVLYDKIDGIWYDYDITLSKPRKLFYPSNFAPLWTNTYDTTVAKEYGRRASNYFYENKLDEYQGGIPSSLDQSGEQWDFPNAWPPLQEFIILGLLDTGNTNATEIAKNLAHLWIRSNKRGFDDSQMMFEKYDALHSGRFGGGGEYTVQAGFGWTNGVALSIINKFFTSS